MKPNSTPIAKDLVLIGGGHSHITVLKKFGMRPIPGVRVTMITRDVHTPYSGMLPGHIAGHYSYDDAHIDLRPLAIFAGARLFHSTAKKIDFENKQVLCPDRPAVKYDVLSINIGSQQQSHNVEGADKFALSIKPIDRFLQNWRDIVKRVRQSNRPFDLTIVGAGAGGVEMSLAAQHRLRAVLKEQGKDADSLHVTLIGADDEILKTHNARVRQKFTRILGERRINLIAGKQVTGVNKNSITFGNTTLHSDATIWATNASAQAWPNISGLATDDGGFIKVNDSLQTINHADVFATGDIAAVVNHPREKSGVFAVRQGPPLTANLRRVLLGKPPRPFRPQTNFLGLISTGDQYAVASRGAWSLEGKRLWRLKDWIDRRFIQNFNDLPEMQAGEDPGHNTQLVGKDAIKALPVAAMRCGGCGAKVGSTILNRVINRLHTLQHDNVVVGLDSPDDAAIVSVPPGKLMVQSVDYFRAFIDDAYIFGRIAANHALGDIFAMGAEAQSALAIATLPYGSEAIVEDQLFQVMSGALSILNESDTALVGGHSSEGVELAFGLTVNGIGDPDRLLRKGDMLPGQAVILTKPVGTGTLLAADMRSKAKGRWIHAAIDNMMLSNRAGAAKLLKHGASACTDVTGFGLLGHLVEMTRASKMDVELNTQAIPLLDGAVECVENGIVSSLQPQNVRLKRAIRDNGFNRESPLYTLLFDPQTAGGLLATVPENQAAACIKALKKTGYPNAAIIGVVKDRQDDLQPVTLS